MKTQTMKPTKEKAIRPKDNLYLRDLKNLVATLNKAGIDIHIIDVSKPLQAKNETAALEPQNSPAPVDIPQHTCYTAGMNNQTTEPSKEETAGMNNK